MALVRMEEGLRRESIVSKSDKGAGLRTSRNRIAVEKAFLFSVYFRTIHSRFPVPAKFSNLLLRFTYNESLGFESRQNSNPPFPRQIPSYWLSEITRKNPLEKALTRKGLTLLGKKLLTFNWSIAFKLCIHYNEVF